MNESETPVTPNNPPPKKSERTVWFVMIALALGLIALIAMNMN